MEDERQPGHSNPDTHAEIDDPSVNKEALGSTVQEVEQPLLGGIGSVVDDLTSGVRGFLIEVLFSIPGTVLHFRNSKTFTVDKSHVLSVSEFVVGQASSLGVHLLIIPM